MLKIEAAEFLGVSKRAVERYIAKGLLPCRYEDSDQGGQLVVLNKADVVALKKRMQPVPNVNGNKPKQLTAGKTGSGATAIAPRAPAQAQLAALVEALRQAAPAPAAVRITERLVLTLQEAAELSGLSVGFLRQAIKDGKLQNIIGGRGYRVRREDLEQFVRGL